MNKRLLIASALAAAIAGPAHRLGPGRPAPSRHSRRRNATASRKQARTTAPPRETTRAPVPEGECRSARLDLRARGLLRADRQRQPDAEGVTMKGAAVTRAGVAQRAAARGRRSAVAASGRSGGRRLSRRWLEVHPENFLANPHAHELLLHIAQRYAITAAHGRVIRGQRHRPGSRASREDSLLVDQLEPILVSGHLAWSTHRGVYLNDLLPLPYDEETLRVVATHVHEVQDALGRPYVVENPASYVGFGASPSTEAEFLAELVSTHGLSDCCAT